MSQARVTLSGAAAGLAAAILFGLSAPCAKLLLPNSGPLVLAGLLYLGAGLGLLAYALLAHGRASQRSSREAAFRLEDGPLLAGVVVMGGIVGPLLCCQGSSVFRASLARCCSTSRRLLRFSWRSSCFARNLAGVRRWPVA
jgi:drug/metabolite transporter (DMT)-like permease